MTVTIAGEGDVSVEPDTLTFTVSDWNYGKTVTASANPDDDVTNDSATLSHTASGGDYGTVLEDLPVTVTDNSAEIVLSESAITVDEEGEDVSYTVKLAAEPTGPVIVTVTGASETILSLEDDSLTFTVDDWNSEQEVIVSADHDDDGSADEFTLTHTAGGGGYDAAPDAELQVTANDNDTADVIISETALTIDEGGDGTYTVKLKTEPTGEVTVTVNDPSNTDVTAEPSSLTFTTETWNNGQPVTVSAKEDDDDTADEAATVTHTVSGADYEDVTAADVEVTVIDNDDPQVTVSFGAASYTVAEGGTVEVTVTLSADPEREVVIPLTATEQDGATGSDYSDVPESVTFESGDTSKTFTFEATDDAVDDDGESVKLGFGGLPTGVTVDTTIPDGETQARDTATVAITDDDKPASVTINFDKDGYTVAEGGTVTVKVTLSDDPEMTVTVPLTATEQGGATTADYSGVPASIVFNSGDTEKSFTFGAEADEVDDDGESVKLTFGTLPAGVTSGAMAESTVAITDDDDPGVKVSFGAASYTVAEGGTVEVTVTLSADPEREVVIPLTRYGREEAAVDTNFNGSLDDYASSATDYSGVPESVTFESGDTSKTFTFEATDDTVDDDGESVKLGFGAMPTGVTVDTTIPDGETQARDTATVSITDDDKPALVTVNFEQDGYTVAEGGTVTVKVTLSDDPEMTVTVPLTATEQDGATGSDYSNVPASLTFNSGDTSKTFTFEATDDTLDDDGESVKLAFGTLPAGVTSGATAESTVAITDDDDPQVTVSFGQATYTAAEGGMVWVTVTLSADPEREVVIPLTRYGREEAAVDTNFNGSLDDYASSATDYSGVPESVTFESGDTSKTFTFEATDDAVDDDGESVKLGFGAMPTGVTVDTTIPAGETQARDTATVSITDDDKPALVTVNFEQDSYTVAEGGTVTVKVTLSDDPEMTVTVPLTATEQDGATTADYSDVPASLTFNSGDTEKEFTFGAEADEVDDDGESVKLGFGTLPAGVASGDTAESTVSITDDDAAGVTITPTMFTVLAGESNQYTVVLDSKPTGPVTVTVSGHSGTDLSVNPSTLTFSAENWDMARTVAVTAIENATAASVTLEHAVSGRGYAEVTADDVTVTIVVAPGELNVQVGVTASQQGLTVQEGGSNTYSVVLSAPPANDVTVAIDLPSGTDLSIDPSDAELTFTPQNWHMAQTVTVKAAEDDDATADELVIISHTVSGGGYDNAPAFSVAVTIMENDTAGVTVSESSLTIDEGGDGTYTVKLKTEPTGEVTVTVNDPSNTDVTAEPESLTFTTETWNNAQPVTVSAKEDDDDTADEAATVTHTVSGADYEDVTAADVEVTVIDNDDPQVTVSFGAASYTVAEGGTVEVTVTLSADPEREVVIPLTRYGREEAAVDTNFNGSLDDYASSATDYSGVPESVTFESGDTSKTFTFEATDDTVDDDGESVKLGFGAMPTGVTVDTTIPDGETQARDTATVSITDDDKPALVTVNFEQDGYTVAEGGAVTVKVTLSDDPEMTVTVPLTATEQDGATTADYSGVPASLTFNSGDTEKEFTFGAEADEVDDDGESVKLGFGTLPAGVASGDTAESTVSITDDDDPQVTVSFGASSYTAAEGGTVEVTITLSADPKREVVIPLTKYGREEAAVDTNFNGSLDDYASSATDYSGVPESVTFESGDTSKTFTFEATDDTLDDDGESVKLGFGAMRPGVTVDTTIPDGETQARDTATVSITDDDDPQVTVSFGASSYTAAEEGTVEVTVTLSADPEREVVIPLTTTEQDGTTGADYSDVPESVTFESGDTSKTFTFEATDDAVDDDGESVKLGFGAMPAGVTAGDTAESTVSITDNDDPGVMVSFGSATCSATEGGDDAEITVYLSVPAPGQVDIPLTATGHYKATPDDWLGVPTVLTFDTGDTSKSFTLVAFDDTVEDDGEMVELGFGTLPDGFVAGSPATTKVTLMNDDVVQADLTVEPDGLTDFATLCGDTRATLTIGTPFEGRLGFSDDIDAIKVAFTAGSNGYRVSLRNEDNEQISAEDFYIGMVHPDDGWMHYVSYDYLTNWETERDTLFIIPEQTGTYCVEVRAKSGRFTGNYNVLVHEAEDPLDSPKTGAESSSPGGDAIEGMPLEISHFHRISVGTDNAIAGEIQESQDSDWYITQLGNRLYRVTVEGSGTGGGTLVGPGLRLRQSDTREFVPENADHTFTPIQDVPRYGSRWLAEFEIEESSSGSDIFHLEVWSIDGNTGTYTITLTAIEEFTYPQEQPQSSEQRASNTPATGGPGINGTHRADETLTATTSQIADEDGLDNAAFAFQWIRHDLTTNTDTDIDGATGSTYTVTSDDDGHAIKVRATFTDDAGNDESLTSYAVLPAPALPEEESSGGGDTTPPQLSAAAVDGATLTLTYDEALDGDSAPAVDAFEVIVGNDTRTVDAVSVADSTVRLTLASVVTSEDAVTVSYTTPAEAADPRIMDIAGNAAASYSGQVVANDTPAGNDPAEGSDEPEDPPQNTLPEGRPVIAGTAQVGETLTADITGISDDDGLENADFTYQWLADDTAVQGATGSTYTLVDADEGRTIKVRVTFTDDAGYEETLTSAATDEVDAAAPPLRASLENTPDSHDGANAFTFELRFSEELSLSYVTLRDHAFTVVKGSVEKVQRMDKPSNIHWRITVRPDGDGKVVITLPATTDCADDGAICTEDGRKLSNRLVLTVSGPGK